MTSRFLATRLAAVAAVVGFASAWQMANAAKPDDDCPNGRELMFVNGGIHTIAPHQ